jgi:hypothetical protein
MARPTFFFLAEIVFPYDWQHPVDACSAQSPSFNQTLCMERFVSASVADGVFDDGYAHVPESGGSSCSVRYPDRTLSITFWSHSWE